MKYYKKFYEVENNKYYVLEADDELYVATESILKISKKKFSKKYEELVQGFKLLKLSAPVAVLFNIILDMKAKDNSISEDMKTYERLSNKFVKDSIKSNYDIVFDEQLKQLEEWYDDLSKKVDDKNKLIKKYNELKDCINRNNPTNNGLINLTNVDYTECNIVRSMVKNGLEHLYTEKVTNFVNNVFLYDLDCFGTVTIYKVTTVKNVVKSVESFIYDRKLIEELMKFIYENDNKKEGK